MVKLNDFYDNGGNPTDGENGDVSAMEAFTMTRRAFADLEARGVSNFHIFNALADLFYQRGKPEISELLAEVAYKCFQQE